MLRPSGIVAGKLAFVTGAGSGIGRATCQVLSREGAIVIAADKNIAAAEETIKSFIAPPAGDQDHSTISLDVNKSASVHSALQEAMKKYNRPPSIVVNSAGITKDNWLLKMSEMDFDDVINVNLKGTFLVMQAFAKAMVDAKLPDGSIVNIASIVGKIGNLGGRPVPPRVQVVLLMTLNTNSTKLRESFLEKTCGQTNYAGSKAGVEGMTKTAAKELGKFNIRVNAVLPGFIQSPMVMTVPEKVRDMIAAQTPLKRIGNPNEVAEVITFLLSDKSSFVTGASFEVTGGFSN